MNCLKCGANNSDTSVFCGNCGNNLKNNENIEKIDLLELDPIYSKEQKTNTQVSYQKIENVTVPNKKNINIKLILIIVLALILVLGGIFVYKKFIDNEIKNDVTSLKYDIDTPILINNDDYKYGYVDTNGKIIIEPKYKEASEFYGEYASVKLKEVVDGEENIKYQIINRKGEKVLTCFNEPKYIEDYNIWVVDSKLYDGNLQSIIKDDSIYAYYLNDGYFKYFVSGSENEGLMNYKGEITYTYTLEDNYSLYIYPSEGSSKLTDQYCRVNLSNYKTKEEKDAIINCNTGKVIYDFTNYEIYDYSYFGIDNYNRYVIKDRSTLKTIEKIYIQNDEIVYRSTDENTSINVQDKGFIRVYDRSIYKYSYIDMTTGKLSDEEPVNFVIFDDWERNTGIKKVLVNNKWGLVSNDREILKTEWDYINYLDVSIYNYLSDMGKEYVLAEKEDKTYLINLKDGNTDAVFNSDDIDISISSIFIAYKDAGTNKYNVYNLVTNKSQKFDVSPSVGLNYFKVYEDNKFYYYNSDFELIYSYNYTLPF